jgi:hypothetical protein
MFPNEGEETRMSGFPAKKGLPGQQSGQRACYQEEGSDYWR